MNDRDEGSRTGEFPLAEALTTAPDFKPATREDLDEHNPAVVYRLLRLVAEDVKITRATVDRELMPSVRRIEVDQIELRADVGRVEVSQAKTTLAIANLREQVKGLEGVDKSLIGRVSALEITTGRILNRLDEQHEPRTVISTIPTVPPTAEDLQPPAVTAPPIAKAARSWPMPVLLAITGASLLAAAAAILH